MEKPNAPDGSTFFILSNEIGIRIPFSGCLLFLNNQLASEYLISGSNTY